MVAEVFYENVTGPEGKNQILEFTPKTGEPMLIACLWSPWSGEGQELLSFAAITDDPEPEVAAAGHDRTIINIKPENVDAWLAGGDPRPCTGFSTTSGIRSTSIDLQRRLLPRTGRGRKNAPVYPGRLQATRVLA
jgi:hypothetical protein